MTRTRCEAIIKEDRKICLKVAGGSNVSKVAGAIAKYIEEGYDVSLQAIGAGAVNQMVKAIVISRGMVASHGYNLTCTPAFIDEMVDGVEKTAIIMYIHTGR